MGAYIFERCRNDVVSNQPMCHVLTYVYMCLLGPGCIAGWGSHEVNHLIDLIILSCGYLMIKSMVPAHVAGADYLRRYFRNMLGKCVDFS